VDVGEVVSRSGQILPDGLELHCAGLIGLPGDLFVLALDGLFRDPFRLVELDSSDSRSAEGFTGSVHALTGAKVPLDTTMGLVPIHDRGLTFLISILDPDTELAEALDPLPVDSKTNVDAIDLFHPGLLNLEVLRTSEARTGFSFRILRESTIPKNSGFVKGFGQNIDK